MKSLLIALAVVSLLSSPACVAERTLNGKLEPGVHSRRDADAVLGPPLRQAGANVMDYQPLKGTQRLTIGFVAESNVIDDIEATFKYPVSRAAIVRGLGLPDVPQAKI